MNTVRDLQKSLTFQRFRAGPDPSPSDSASGVYHRIIARRGMVIPRDANDWNALRRGPDLWHLVAKMQIAAYACWLFLTQDEELPVQSGAGELPKRSCVSQKRSNEARIDFEKRVGVHRDAFRKPERCHRLGNMANDPRKKRRAQCKRETKRTAEHELQAEPEGRAAQAEARTCQCSKQARRVLQIQSNPHENPRGTHRARLEILCR